VEHVLQCIPGRPQEGTSILVEVDEEEGAMVGSREARGGDVALAGKQKGGYCGVSSWSRRGTVLGSRYVPRMRKKAS
jgi:hypothetical protein